MFGFSSEPTWAWCFLIWKVINYWPNFFNRHKPIHIVYCFLCEYWQIVSFKGLVHFFWVTNFVDIELCIVFLYYPFNGMCNDVPSFISDITNLCPLSFFLMSLSRGLSILLLFSKTSFWFHWFFSTDFLFPISLISTLIFNISFLLITLDLICSSFSSLLRWTLRWLTLDLCFLIYAFNAVWVLYF